MRKISIIGVLLLVSSLLGCDTPYVLNEIEDELVGQTFTTEVESVAVYADNCTAQNSESSCLYRGDSEYGLELTGSEECLGCEEFSGSIPEVSYVPSGSEYSVHSAYVVEQPSALFKAPKKLFVLKDEHGNMAEASDGVLAALQKYNDDRSLTDLEKLQLKLEESGAISKIECFREKIASYDDQIIQAEALLNEIDPNRSTAVQIVECTKPGEVKGLLMDFSDLDTVIQWARYKNSRGIYTY